MNHTSILIIDDEPTSFDIIETFLSDQNYQLHYANTGQKGISTLNTCQPDLIMLDVLMPDLDGMEICQRIKAMAQWHTTPILMVTCLGSKDILSQCLAVGADDYIDKPVDRLELRARVKSMLRIRQKYQKFESSHSHLEKILQRQGAELQTMIFQDTLTGLPNRRFIISQIAEILSLGQKTCAVIYLDCDQFKLVNGSFGHKVGDQLLCEISKRLTRYLSPGDVCGRMGEDEFCIVLKSIHDIDTLQSFILRIQKSFEASFSVMGSEFFLTVSIGGDISTKRTQEPEELVQNADIAMYQAKASDEGNYKIFNHQMRLVMLEQLTLENDLQRALEQQEFILNYQPILNLKTREIKGVEALIRWPHPDRGIVSPREFIPSMETSGLIIPVGLKVFLVACQQLAKWQQQGWSDLTMSINLSVRQLAYPKLLSDIDYVLSKTHVNPTGLNLEITESTVLDNSQQTISIIEQLRSRQIQISIDDFGTGYSSLEYLHHFSVDSLKIDQSFILHLEENNLNW